MKVLPPPVFALFLALGLTGLASAQKALTPATPPPPARIEPGLERAVEWKWWIVPSDEAAWGLKLPEAGDPAAPSLPGAAPSGPRPSTYDVQRGDALVKIARKFGMTADQLKAFNGLTSDTIHIGQSLKIPTLVELSMMAPPPPPPETQGKAKKKAADSPPPVAPPRPTGPLLTSEAQSEAETVLIQVFLDRENFSTGYIDGRGGPVFNKVRDLYLTARPEVVDLETLREKAASVVGNSYTTYVLKREDFRFIAPVQEQAPVSGYKRKGKSGATPVQPPPTYEELVAAPMLAYRSPWEFVAERYHCEEAFLRKLNAKLTGVISVGMEFLVPNVLPFEIEKAFEGPLQPQADPQNPVVAAVVELARVEITRGDKLIAVMPMTVARPDLRGRGTWTILDAIPRPRLATQQEVKEAPKKKSITSFAPTVSTPEPEPPPPSGPLLSGEQFLQAGPNNPVGIIWINLAKANSTEPLPYGLHGTSIPERMKTQESIGGIRVANWDIVRAVRLLPPGTPLKWK